MVKKILTVSLLSTMLLFSGCGDSEGESQLEIQQMLDDGDYSGVISALESSANSYEDYIALGAAYMGRAGFSLTAIVNAMSSDSESGDGFAGFITNTSTQSSSSALSDLGKSSDSYKRVVAGACADSNATLSDSQKDICLYIGLANTTKAAVTIGLLADDISVISDDNNGTDDKLTATTCAMQYAFDGGSDVNVDTAVCTIVESADVNFTVIDKLYTPLTVDVNASSYYYLMTDSNQTVLTDGYCTATDFSTRTDEYNSTAVPTLYACPLNEDKDADEITTAEVLVDALNEGTDSISAATTEEMQADIDEFKCEILGGTYDFDTCSEDITQDVTEEDVIDYLNSENS